MTPSKPPIRPLDLVRTPAQAVKLLRVVLGWVTALERAGWKPVALRPDWPRGIPARPSGRHPGAERRALAHELRLLHGWLAQRADGQAIDLPMPGVVLSLRAPAGPGPGALSLSLPPDVQPPPPHVLRAMVAVALLKATVARCARPTCGGLFVQPARGRPKRYCSDRCAWADRAQQWRQAHYDKFRDYRKQAYRRRQQHAHGPRVRIQARRRAAERLGLSAPESPAPAAPA